MGTLPEDDQGDPEDVLRALTRRGQPAWSSADFQRLLQLLGQAGLGWIDEQSVERELEAMADAWPESPHSPLDVQGRP